MLLPENASCARAARLLSAILVLMAASPAAASDAEVERTITIVELRQGPDAASLTVDYLKAVREAFGSQNKGDFILVPPETIAGKLGRNRQQVPRALTPERRTSLSEAKKAGINYLDRADALNAVKALQAAQSKYRAALAAPGADAALRNEYLDVLAQLATAHVVAQQKDEASEVFRDVITTFGLDAKITDDNYRPDVVEIFKGVVKDVKQLKKGSLDVSSAPLGAAIILGGNDRGPTPKQIDDLIPGAYALRLQRGSDTSMLHRVRIDGGQTAKIHIDIPFESHLVLDDTSAGLGYKDIEEARNRIPLDAVTLGRAVELNLVAVVGVMDDKLVVYLIDVSKSRVVNSNTSISVPQVGLSKKAVRRAVSVLIGEQKEAEAEASPWYTSVPGWAFTGVGLVSTVVGIALAPWETREVYPCPDPDEKCIPAAVGSPTYQLHLQGAQDRQAELESQHTLGAVSIGLGVALIGTGAFFFYKHATGDPIFGQNMWQPDTQGRLLAMPPLDFGSSPVTFSAFR